MQRYEYELQYETPEGKRKVWGTFLVLGKAEAQGAQLVKDKLAVNIIIRTIARRKRVQRGTKWVLAE